MSDTENEVEDVPGNMQVDEDDIISEPEPEPVPQLDDMPELEQEPEPQYELAVPIIKAMTGVHMVVPRVVFVQEPQREAEQQEEPEPEKQGEQQEEPEPEPDLTHDDLYRQYEEGQLERQHVNHVEEGQNFALWILNNARQDFRPFLETHIKDLDLDYVDNRGDNLFTAVFCFLIDREIIQENGMACLRLLAANKIDINHVGATGRSALMIAAGRSNENYCKFLLELGCTVDTRDRMGRTAFFYLCNNGDANEGVVRMFLDIGADINATTIDGFTPAMCFFARTQNVELMKLFANKGIRQDIYNANGRNAAMVTVMESNRVDVVRYALQHMQYNAFKKDHEGSNILSSVRRRVSMLSPEVKVNFDDCIYEPGSCGICADHLDAKVVFLKCDHPFHMECLISVKMDVCPVCKVEYYKAPFLRKSVAVPKNIEAYLCPLFKKKCSRPKKH